MPAFSWTDDFQRNVMWCAVYGSLLQRVPGSFNSRMFAPDTGESSTPSPRVRLARLVEPFTEAPGAAIVDGLVDGLARTLPPSERQALDDEWTDVRGLQPPGNLEFIEQQVAYWARRSAVVQALVRAADLLKNPSGGAELDQAHTVLSAAWDVGRPSTADLVPLLASVEDQMDWWRRGQDDVYRIPTGFSPLDRCLNGGILPGECFYFLAPPKGAKTSSLTRVALGASQARLGVAMFSFEMMTRPMRARFDRAMTGATKRELQDDPYRLGRAVAGYTASGAGEIWLWTGISQQKDSVGEIARTVDRIRNDGHRIDLVVIDYLNIMGSGKTVKEREKRHELAGISREISAMAKTEGVGTWSAALINRAAVNKEVVRKTDIAEAFEVVAVADGMVAVCSPPIWRAQGLRRFYLAAVRDEEDERWAGTYRFEGDRMAFTVVPDPPPSNADTPGDAHA